MNLTQKEKQKVIRGRWRGDLGTRGNKKGKNRDKNHILVSVLFHLFFEAQSIVSPGWLQIPDTPASTCPVTRLEACMSYLASYLFFIVYLYTSLKKVKLAYMGS